MMLEVEEEEEKWENFMENLTLNHDTINTTASASAAEKRNENLILPICSFLLGLGPWYICPPSIPEIKGTRKTNIEWNDDKDNDDDDEHLR